MSSATLFAATALVFNGYQMCNAIRDQQEHISMHLTIMIQAFDERLDEQKAQISKIEKDLKDMKNSKNER